MKRIMLVFAWLLMTTLGLAQLLSGHAGAQGGGDQAIGALATQAAIEALATRQAIEAGQAAGNAQSEAAQIEALAAEARARAASQAAQATRQAAALQAQQAQAQATSAAAVLQATISAAATAQSVQATAVTGALYATATAQAQAVAAQATRDSQDAQATRAAYTLAYTHTQNQARLEMTLLYLLAGVAAAVVLYIAMVGARSLGQRLEQAGAGGGRTPSGVGPARPAPAHAAAGDVVIDVTPSMPLPTLPGQSSRMGHVRVINDPRIVAAALNWFDNQGDDHEYTD